MIMINLIILQNSSNKSPYLPLLKSNIFIEKANTNKNYILKPSLKTQHCHLTQKLNKLSSTFFLHNNKCKRKIFKFLTMRGDIRRKTVMKAINFEYEKKLHNVACEIFWWWYYESCLTGILLKLEKFNF